ncbi:DUF262 domain-containing protein [Pseudoduganella sp. FT26W]|uniref:DUF262 domain-containing protein n=1 Tax=Duganella aquatilis TaxID=2666082 RepID=A0A844DBR6_9BURK|nr:DUF262 domain-containing protein [Duganella aquatilis]MRW86372.1 DUF262 domain-containing protein [Duganella aquatilis]
MSKYKVRPRDLVDIVRDIREGSIILSPYFQRKLVWRLTHKIDFIKTILLGYPFPEIFLSRGTLDVVTMRSTMCVVDGQQRMTTIQEFINNEFAVDGKTFAQLHEDQQKGFLKYEIAIIDLDLEQNDPEIIEIFQRLNRTFYALSTIEKMSAEYGSSDFMLIAKLLCGELRKVNGDDTENENVDNVFSGLSKTDPNIDADFVAWGNKQNISSFLELIVESSIFTRYEIQRQTHLAYTLNLMATITGGYYNRNEQLEAYLDQVAEFEERDKLVTRLNDAAKIFLNFKFPKNSAWFSKSNAFTLINVLDAYGGDIKKIGKIKMKEIRENLIAFIDAPPADYALAAREAVNNKRQRMARHNTIANIFAATIEA